MLNLKNAKLINMKLTIQHFTSIDSDGKTISVLDIPQADINWIGLSMEDYQKVSNSWETVQLPNNEFIEINAFHFKHKPKIVIRVKQGDEELGAVVGDSVHSLTTRTLQGTIIGIGVS